jgi:hypothetical protein
MRLGAATDRPLAVEGDCLEGIARLDRCSRPKLKDGNRALGLMQINTIHLPNLARFGIRREHLFDACTSQKVGPGFWPTASSVSALPGSPWAATTPARHRPM